jgi:hypothetical protein
MGHEDFDGGVWDRGNGWGRCRLIGRVNYVEQPVVSVDSSDCVC